MGKPQTFRSPTAVLAWVVWLLFAVGNWADIAVQGRDHLSLVAAAILLLGTGIAYVTGQRPRLIAADDGLTIRNPLRDHRVSWPTITKVDLADLLRVHCDWDPARPEEIGQVTGPAAETTERALLTERPDAGVRVKKSPYTKVISAWAVHYSRRRQIAAENRARRNASGGARSLGMRRPTFGMGYGAPALPADSASEAEAQKAVRILTERAKAAKGAPPAPVQSTWSRPALLALLIPALVVLIVCLI